MFNFLTLKPIAFGLDISDLSLKIVQLKKKGRFFDLTSFGETRIKPGIIERGEIKNEKMLAEEIKKAVKDIRGEKIKTKYVVISLPEEKAFLQVIQLPFMKEGEAKKAVYFEAENYIPLPIDKVYLDSQIISYDTRAQKLNVLMVALPKTTIDPYINSLKAAGLRPLSLEIESMSISRALVKERLTYRPLLLMDLGENRTGFSLFFDSSLRFTTTSQISAKSFSEIIADNLKVSFKQAEALKIENGIGQGGRGRKMAEILSQELTQLVMLARKYVNYCEKQYNQKVDKILLCGGGANLKGLVSFLSQQLQMPVELGNPWINILPASPAGGSDQSKRKTIKHLSYEESLRYTTALGLALRGAKT